MTWEIVAHRGFQRGLRGLGSEAEARIREAVHRLAYALDKRGAIDAREAFASAPVVPDVDLRALRGSNIPGSYRLRVGPWRVALVILPDERTILLTVATRRDETSYRKLPDLHRRRFHDR